MLRFDREQNSVKQLSFNKKINKFKKIDLSTTIIAIHLFKSSSSLTQITVSTS